MCQLSPCIKWKYPLLLLYILIWATVISFQAIQPTNCHFMSISKKHTKNLRDSWRFFCILQSQKCVMGNVHSTLWLLFSPLTLWYFSFIMIVTSPVPMFFPRVDYATKSGSLLNVFCLSRCFPSNFHKTDAFHDPKFASHKHWSFDSIGLIKTLEMYLLLAAGYKRLVRDESHTFIAYSLIFPFMYV